MNNITWFVILYKNTEFKNTQAILSIQTNHLSLELRDYTYIFFTLELVVYYQTIVGGASAVSWLGYQHTIHIELWNNVNDGLFQQFGHTWIRHLMTYNGLKGLVSELVIGLLCHVSNLQASIYKTSGTYLVFPTCHLLQINVG